MKKTTYALIALIGALFLGTFLFFFILSLHPDDKDRWSIVSIEGPETETALGNFNRIEVIDSLDHYSFYNYDNEMYSYPVFCISVSDSVQTPSIKMKEGWNDFISYLVEDSTLTITFKTSNKWINSQDAPVDITVPSLTYASFDYDGLTRIYGGDFDDLKVDLKSAINLDSISARKVEINFTKNDETSITTKSSRIDRLDVMTNYQTNLYNYSQVDSITLSATEYKKRIYVNLYGKYSGVVKTVASDDQDFEVSTFGSNTIKFE